MFECIREISKAINDNLNKTLVATVEKKITGKGKRLYAISQHFRDDFVIEFSFKLEKEFFNLIKAHNELIIKKENEVTLRAISSMPIENGVYEQGTDGWLNERLGFITASNNPFTITGHPVPTFNQYVYKKVAEFLKFKVLKEEREETYTTKGMMRGHTYEPIAREAYEIEELAIVEEVPFKFNSNHRIGVSLDGINTSNQRGVEIKCPSELSVFLAHWHDGHLCQVYSSQIQFQMLVTGIKSVDLVVFYPHFEPHVTEIKADESIHLNMARTIDLFNEKFDQILETMEQFIDPSLTF